MGIFVAKAVKPSKLKIDGFRLEFLNEMRKVGKLMKGDLNACVETWEHQPKFDFDISLRGEGPSLYMYVAPTDDEAGAIFNWVDKGTKPHEIWAGYYTGKSEHKTLAFASTFTPKTQPHVIGSGPGASGPPMVFVPMVNHPGSEARGFTDDLQEKWEPLFRDHMEDAMRRAAAKCGHALTK